MKQMCLMLLIIVIFASLSYFVTAQNDFYTDDSTEILGKIEKAIQSNDIASIVKYKPIFDKMLYFVELKGDPLSIEYAERFERYGGFYQGDVTLSRLKRDLVDEHNRVRSKIRGINKKIIFDDDLYIALNGFFIKKDNLGPSDLYKIQEVPGVKKVYADNLMHLFLDETVPLIGADKVWEQNQFGSSCAAGEECLTGKGVKVAIIDTGIDYTHPDFGACTKTQFLQGECEKVKGGYDFGNKDDDPFDKNGHGTHVAGIIAAKSPDKNKNGIYCEIKEKELCGIAPDAELYMYKIIYEWEKDVTSVSLTFFSSVLKSFEAASDLDKNVNADMNGDGNNMDYADIISMSLGLASDPNDAVAEALSNLVAMGVVAVVGIGNSGSSGLFSTLSPGNEEDVLGVGASCKPSQVGVLQDRFGNAGCDNGEFGSGIDGRLASFSSKGPTSFGTFKPDILAPGHYICSVKISDTSEGDPLLNAYPDCIDDKHIALSGTSMATPVVSGAAALLKQKNPNWNAYEIKYTLKGTAEDLGLARLYQGDGQIDIFAAVNSEDSYPQATLYIGDDLFVKGYVDIKGTAESYSSSGFAEYILEYSEGIDQDVKYNPKKWKRITSSTKPNKGLLYRFDSSSIKDDTFTLRLIVRDNSGRESIDQMVLFKKPASWKGNFPKKVLADTSFKSIAPIFGDLNGDGVNEIVVGIQTMNDAMVYLFDIKGDLLWSKQLLPGVGATPALGDINGDGNLDIPFMGTPFFGNDDYVFAWDYYGNDIFPPIVENRGFPSASLKSPTVSDINRDGKSEILIAQLTGNKIYENNGQIMHGPWDNINSYQFEHNNLLAADINGDGYKEIITIASERRSVNNDYEYYNVLYIMDANDVLFRKEYKNKIGSNLNFLAIGNVDTDKNVEVIFYSDFTFRIIDGKDFSVQNEFSVENEEVEGIKIEGLFSPFILADVDGDDQLEIIYKKSFRSLSFIMAKDYDGTTVGGYPIISNGLESVTNFDTLIFSNAHGDNDLEPIITLNQGKPEVYFIKLDKQRQLPFVTTLDDYGILTSGLDHPQFSHIPQNWPDYGGVIVEDIDNDGKNEFLSTLYTGIILAQSSFLGSYVFFQDLDAPKVDGQWGMYYYDAQRSNSVLSSDSLIEGNFIRGDANSDGIVDLTDAIYLLNFLFQGGPTSKCQDAVDTNDDGIVDLTDAIYLLNHLFVGGKSPHSPYPGAGSDPTKDQLSC